MFLVITLFRNPLKVKYSPDCNNDFLCEDAVPDLEPETILVDLAQPSFRSLNQFVIMRAWPMLQGGQRQPPGCWRLQGFSTFAERGRRLQAPAHKEPAFT